MNVAFRKPMTLAQFLAWEERQALRYEFDGFNPVAMAGGTAAYAAIQRNLIVALGTRLRGQKCQPYGSELKIEVAGRIRYPDAFVICTPILPRTTVVSEPVVVFEIISEGSAHDDAVVKNAEYRAAPSVQRYVILQQTHAGALVFHRKGEDWLADTVTSGAILELPEVVLAIPLAEIYADIELEPETVEPA